MGRGLTLAALIVLVVRTGVIRRVESLKVEVTITM